MNHWIYAHSYLNFTWNIEVSTLCLGIFNLHYDSTALNCSVWWEDAIYKKFVNLVRMCHCAHWRQLIFADQQSACCDRVKSVIAIEKRANSGSDRSPLMISPSNRQSFPQSTSFSLSSFMCFLQPSTEFSPASYRVFPSILQSFPW